MARMPSIRRFPQAPAPVVPQPPVALAPVVAVAVSAGPGGMIAVAQPEPDDFESAAAAARAGGFHESSYELRLGLEVSESVWSEDLVPRDWPVTR